jgi:hypothetical protein
LWDLPDGGSLTILHLDVPPTLARTLHKSESMIGICRDHAANVKNWRDGLQQQICLTVDRATQVPRRSGASSAAKNLVMGLDDEGCRAWLLRRDRDGEFPSGSTPLCGRWDRGGAQRRPDAPNELDHGALVTVQVA